MNKKLIVIVSFFCFALNLNVFAQTTDSIPTTFYTNYSKKNSNSDKGYRYGKDLHDYQEDALERHLQDISIKDSVNIYVIFVSELQDGYIKNLMFKLNGIIIIINDRYRPIEEVHVVVGFGLEDKISDEDILSVKNTILSNIAYNPLKVLTEAADTLANMVNRSDAEKISGNILIVIILFSVIVFFSVYYIRLHFLKQMI